MNNLGETFTKTMLHVQSSSSSSATTISSQTVHEQSSQSVQQVMESQTTIQSDNGPMTNGQLPQMVEPCSVMAAPSVEINQPVSMEINISSAKSAVIVQPQIVQHQVVQQQTIVQQPEISITSSRNAVSKSSVTKIVQQPEVKVIASHDISRSATTKMSQRPMAPRFTLALQDVSVTDGEHVVFKVMFAANPKPSVVWFFNSQAIKESSDFAINIDIDNMQSTLTIKEVYPEDEGEYMCKAQNEYGAAVTHCHLFVKLPTSSDDEMEKLVSRTTEVVQQTMPVQVKERSSFSETLSLDTKNRFKEFKMQFQIPDRKAEKSEIAVRQQAALQGMKMDVELAPHVNTYQAHSSINLQQRQSQQQTVEHRKFATKQMQMLNLPLEQQRRFSETIAIDRTAVNKRQVQVEFNIPEQPEQKKERSSIEIRQQAPLKGVKMEIEIAQKEKKRAELLFKQKKHATAIETQRQEFHMMLEGSPPHFTSELKSSRVMDGEEIKFACTVVGNPMPNITWYKNGKVIVDNPDFLTTFDKKTGLVTLHIIEVFPQDTGEYRCIAVNQFGRAVTGATLQVDVFEYIPDSEEASASAAESIPERIVSEDEVEFIERTQAFIANMQKLRQELEQEHVEEDIIEMHEEYHEETVQMADVKWQIPKKGSMMDIEFQQEWTEDAADTDTEISEEQMIQQKPFERGALRRRPQMQAEYVIADISSEEIGLEEVRSESPQQHEEREIMMQFEKSSIRRRPEVKAMQVEEIVSLDEIGFDEVRCQSPETTAETKVSVKLAKSKKLAPRGSLVAVQEQFMKPQVVEESQERIPSPEKASDEEIVVNFGQSSIESAKTHFTGYVEEHHKAEEEEDIFFESTEPELQGTNVCVELDMAYTKEKSEMQSITQQAFLELTETEVAQTEYDEEQSKEEQIAIVVGHAAKELAKPSRVGLTEDIVSTLEAEGFEVEMTEETSVENKVEVILGTHATQDAKPSHIGQTEEQVDIQFTEESIEAVTEEESTKEEIRVDLSAAHKQHRPLTQAPSMAEDVPPEGIGEEYDANIKEIRLIPGVELPSYEPAVVESYRLETRVKWQTGEEENLIESPFLVEDEAASMGTRDSSALNKANQEGQKFQTQTQSMKMNIEAAEDKKIEQVAEQAIQEVSPSVKLMAAKAAEQVVRAAQEVTEEKEIITETITDEIEVIRPIMDEEIIPDISQDVRMRPQQNNPPSFSTDLRNMTVSDGDKVLMECRVIGNPRPQIKWFVDGMELSSSEDFQMTYNEDGYVSLYINDALPEDEGEYLVEAFNCAGKSVSTAYLTVIHSIGTSPEPIEGQLAQQKTRDHLVQQSMKKMEIDIEMQKQKHISIVEVPIPAQPAAPKFTRELESREVYETMPVTLECHISGNPAPDVMWYQDGKKITSTKHIKLEYSQGVCRLHIDRATVEDEAEYVCEARNEHGMQSTMSELLVEKLINAVEQVILEEFYEIEIHMCVKWPKPRNDIPAM